MNKLTLTLTLLLVACGTDITNVNTPDVNFELLQQQSCTVVQNKISVIIACPDGTSAYIDTTKTKCEHDRD